MVILWSICTVYCLMTGRKQREKMEKDDSVVHDNKKTTTITSYRLCTIANRIEEKSPNIEKNRKNQISSHCPIVHCSERNNE